MSTFTPGPWRIESPNGNVRATVKVKGEVPIETHLVFANLTAGLSYEERLANARLIAAAPELLAALADLLEVAEPIIRECDRRSALNFCDYARAAIAKATQP